MFVRDKFGTERWQPNDANVCLHEASHAVIAHALGLLPLNHDAVVIITDNGMAGKCRIESMITGRRGAAHHIVARFAGCIAATLLGGADVDESFQVSRNDVDGVFRLMDKHFAKPSHDSILAATENMAWQLVQEHADEIRAVAEALQVKRSLSTNQLRWLMKGGGMGWGFPDDPAPRIPTAKADYYATYSCALMH